MLDGLVGMRISDPAGSAGPWQARFPGALRRGQFELNCVCN